MSFPKAIRELPEIPPTLPDLRSISAADNAAIDAAKKTVAQVGEELGELAKRSLENRDFATVGYERLKRWKARAVELISKTVHPNEGTRLKAAAQFAFTSDPLKNFIDEVQAHNAVLTALSESLDSHPSDVLNQPAETIMRPSDLDRFSPEQLMEAESMGIPLRPSDRARLPAPHLLELAKRGHRLLPSEVSRLTPNETLELQRIYASLPTTTGVSPTLRDPASVRRDTEFLKGFFEGSQSMLSIFISHSSTDKGLAELVVHLLKSSLRLKATDIRCTSVDGYRLPGGADTDEVLKREVLAAKSLIGIISLESMRSMYVAFELGARWGINKHLLPLLAPGVHAKTLDGPLSGLNALHADSRSQLIQMVTEVGKVLGIEPDSPASWVSQLDAIIALKGDSEAEHKAAELILKS